MKNEGADVIDHVGSRENGGENNIQHHMVFEHAPVGIICLSPDGSFKDMNVYFCTMLGYSREELIGKKFRDITHPDDIEDNETLLQRIIIENEAKPYIIEKRYICKGGTVCWVKLTTRLVRNAEGEPQYFITMLEDTTVQRKAEEKRRYLLMSEQSARAEAEATANKLLALQTITDTALAHLRHIDLLQELLARTQDMLSADISVIFLLSDDGQTLIPRVVSGMNKEDTEDMTLHLGEGIAGQIAIQRAAMIVDDIKRYKDASPVWRDRVASLLGVPLLVEGQLIGVMQIGTSSPRIFTWEDVDLLQRVADRLALAIEHARLRDAEQQAQQDAIETANQLQAVFGAMTEGVFVYDQQGRFVHANAAACVLFGFHSEEDVIGKPYLDCLGHREMCNTDGHPLPLDALPVSRILRGEAMSGKEATDIILPMPKKSDVHLSVTGAPVQDQCGHIIGGVCVFRDVTEQRKKERRTLQVLNMLLNLAEVLVRVPDQLPISHNEELPSTDFAFEAVGSHLDDFLCQMLDCQRAMFISIEPQTGKMHLVALAGLSSNDEQDCRADIERSVLLDYLEPETISKLCSNEVVMRNLQQQSFVQRSAYGLQNLVLAPIIICEQLVGLFGLDKSASDGEYTREEIGALKAVAKLAALVIERTRLLHEWSEARSNEMVLQETNHRFNEFLSIASHELRTPLTTIHGNIQLALRRLDTLKRQEIAFTEKLIEKLARVERPLIYAVHRANVQNRMISDLLDASRIQSNKLELIIHRCNLVEIVHNAVEDQQHTVIDRTILLNIHSGEMLVVMADPDRIGQVVNNYLTNALRYSPPHNVVEVSVEVEDEVARVSVHDQGPGISSEDQERIWERFYRAKGVEIQHGSGMGLGLGLHISRTIIERHHGQVGVESKLGEGSTFWFTLPLATSATLKS